MAGYKWSDEELELLRRLRAQGVTPVQMQPHFPGRSVVHWDLERAIRERESLK